MSISVDLLSLSLYSRIIYAHSIGTIPPQSRCELVASVRPHVAGALSCDMHCRLSFAPSICLSITAVAKVTYCVSVAVVTVCLLLLLS